MKKRPPAGTNVVLSAEEMRSLESAALASGAVSGRALMERAGQGAVAQMLAEWPDLDQAPRSAAVLCGPGNNGGDGYVMARALEQRGWRVKVFALGDPARLPPDARANHDLWAEAGEVQAMPEAVTGMAGCDVVIDALFGIGLTRALDANVDAVLRAVPGAAHKLSVDVPSGRDTDSGTVIGDIAFPADLTVTFHARKPVHSVLEAAGGAVRVVDIGL